MTTAPQTPDDSARRVEIHSTGGPVTVSVPTQPDDHSILVDIHSMVDLLDRKVEQVRWALGLNGDLSPEAAKKQAGRIRVVMTKDTAAQERREHWRVAWRDLLVAGHLASLRRPAKWVVMTLSAAILFGLGASFGPVAMGWAASNVFHLGG